MFKKISLGLILAVSAVIFFHNIIVYPPRGGFDYVRRTTYSKIISNEFRLPTYEETSEVYDAPAFYFLSGMAARAIAAVSHSEFLDALAGVRFLTAILGLASFYLWYKIFNHLYPKNKFGSLFFLLFLASVPVFYRAGAMIVSELLTCFNTALTFYYFICHFLTKPSYKKSVILSLLISFGLLARISFFSVTFAIFTGILIFFISKKKGFTGIKFVTVISLIVLVFTGWFYLVRQQGKLLNFGTVKELYDKAPYHEPIRLDFYYGVPFKLMMNYPVRPYLSYPSYFLPIYYADFWGDYWNYFAQTRFGPNEFQAAKTNRQTISDARRKYLSWQVKVNLIPTLLMVAAFLYVLTSRAVAIIKNKTNLRVIAEFVFSITVVFIWGSMVAILTKYPGGEGDWIKAPYTLLIIPIYIYLTSVFIFSILRKITYIYWPTLIILLLAIVNNLIFSWF